MDVIVAARLSQKIKGRAQSGIESQDEDAREFAEEEGHNVIETVADHASGSKAMWERKNLRPWVTDPDLMARYQGIVAAKQDRLSREDWGDEVELRKWAEANGKTLFIVDRGLRWPPRKSHYDDDVEAWNRGAEAARREWNETSKRYRRMQKRLRDNNFLTGRASYGYRIAGVNCGQVPCRCAEKQIDDHKTLVIYEPEAAVIREARDKYLGGDSLQDICDDFNARMIPSPTFRGEPGKEWTRGRLSEILRNPATAGRRMDGWRKPEHERKTVLQFPGIITWAEREQIGARMDARAHRRGIAPANAYLLTGIISDEAGHRLYHVHARRPEHIYYCHQKCGLTVPMEEVDQRVSDAVVELYGHFPHLVRRVIPGQTNFEAIAKLRQDRNELDDTKDDYLDRMSAITAEIKRLILEDQESPRPETVRWVDSGIKIRDYWKGLTIPQRRDWLKVNGWKVTVSKVGGRLEYDIDAGYSEDVAMEAQLRSLGLDIENL
jgi:DNA invertase Pin-like site-specific DNA recombinase